MSLVLDVRALEDDDSISLVVDVKNDDSISLVVDVVVTEEEDIILLVVDVAGTEKEVVISLFVDGCNGDELVGEDGGLVGMLVLFKVSGVVVA